MSSHDDSFVCSGSSPSLMVCRDCWLTTVGIVPIEKGKQHRDYFVPEGEKPSKQFGLDLGHVRVSTLGTNGSSLHFEFNKLNPQTSRLIVDASKASRTNFVNLEFHLPNYSLRSNLNPQAAISFLERVAADFFIEDHFSVFLLRPITASALDWIEQNIGKHNGFQPYWPTVVIEHRYISDILRGIAAGGAGFVGFASALAFFLR